MLAFTALCLAGVAAFEIPWFSSFLKIRAAALSERPLVEELRTAGCVFNETIWWNANGGSLLTGWAIKGPYAQIQHIRFTKPDVSSVPFGKLKALKRLESLDLSGTNVREDQLASLEGMELVSIQLRRTAITAPGLQHLARVQGLTYLKLDGSSVTDDMLLDFNPPSLAALSLADTRITDVCLATVGRIMTLDNLNLSRTKVSDKGIEKLSQSHFDTLNLSGTLISNQSLALLNARFGNCRLALDVSHTQISDAGLEACARMFLEQLDLSGTQVSDVGLEHLKNLDYLKRLDVGGTRVTAAGANMLVQARNARREAFARSQHRNSIGPSQIEIVFSFPAEKNSPSQP